MSATLCGVQKGLTSSSPCGVLGVTCPCGKRWGWWWWGTTNREDCPNGVFHAWPSTNTPCRWSAVVSGTDDDDDVEEEEEEVESATVLRPSPLARRASTGYHGGEVMSPASVIFFVVVRGGEGCRGSGLPRLAVPSASASAFPGVKGVVVVEEEGSRLASSCGRSVAGPVVSRVSSCVASTSRMLPTASTPTRRDEGGGGGGGSSAAATAAGGVELLVG